MIIRKTRPQTKLEAIHQILRMFTSMGMNETEKKQEHRKLTEDDTYLLSWLEV